jgi:hypothetical protein
LCALLPPARWTKASDLLILHGRRICRPTPLCERCNARKDCDFYRSGGLVAKAGRAKPKATRVGKAVARVKAMARGKGRPLRKKP